MNEREHKLLSKEMKRLKKEVSNNPEKARELLMSTGMYTKTGKLKKIFR